MGKMVGIFACFLILALDVTAGILGIKAEAAQNQEKHLRVWVFECKEPSHHAYVLGFSAAVILGVAHLVANLVGGCTGFVSRDEMQKSAPSKKLSMACLVFTWIIVVVAMSMLVIGTKSNSKSRGSCGLTHHHLLFIGGILCFIHSLFALSYYVTSTPLFH